VPSAPLLAPSGLLRLARLHQVHQARVDCTAPPLGARLLRARLVLTRERLLPRMLPRLQRAAPLRLRPLVRRR